MKARRSISLVLALLLAGAAAVQATAGTARWAASPLGDVLGDALSNESRFEVRAAAATSLTLSQVSSTIYELSGVEVTGLGNAANAALEQELRGQLQNLQDLGESQGRTARLTVERRTPAGTEISTRWAEGAGTEGAAGEGAASLTELLLPGGAGGAVAVSPRSVSDGVSSSISSWAALPSLLQGAPYGAALVAGDRVSSVTEQALGGTFGQLLAAAPALISWNLPRPETAGLPPLQITQERVYQGQNSRGEYLFQTQSHAEPWQQTLGGARNEKGEQGRLTLEVLDMARMSQAVYRADGLPASSFEFSTLQLQITAQQGAAQVRFTVQVRSTAAVRPLGTPLGALQSPAIWG